MTVPYKSKSQVRFMFGSEKREEVPVGTAKRWAAHTPDIKKLPERAGDTDKKAFAAAFLLKCAADGVTDLNAIATRAEALADQLEAKAANDSPSMLGRAAGFGTGATLLGAGLGLAIPAGLGYLGGAGTALARNQMDTDDADSLRTAALANAYRRRAAEAKMNAQVQKLVESNPGQYVRIG